MTDAGRGRLFLDPAKQHDDLRLLRMAIRKRWDISDEFRGIALERLKRIVAGPDDEMALKAIAEARHMEAQNQKDEHKIVDIGISSRLAELDAIAADLGVEVAAIEDATRAGAAGNNGTQGGGHSAAQ